MVGVAVPQRPIVHIAFPKEGETAFVCLDPAPSQASLDKTLVLLLSELMIVAPLSDGRPRFELAIGQRLAM